MDGGGVSSAAIEVLLQNLIDVFKQEYSLIRDLGEEVKQLEKTLRMIQAYLNDAEKKSISEDSVKVWLRELEALTFEADNVLDEFSYHLLRKKVKNMKSPPKKVQSFFSPLKHIATRRNMALKIKKINKNFESMSKRASDLGLQSMIVNASDAVYASIETDSLTLDPIFIGRDDDVEKLVDVATGALHGRKFSILAIVGMGGLGKTTLTRKVFNHQKMEARFGQSRIWVHVSQTFDPVILFKKVLSVVLPNQTGEAVEGREAILRKLQEALKDKTYLLVLDDVWNQDVPKWEDFMNSISGVTNTEGNTIIMSTRKEDVASLVRPLHTHPLKGLSVEECWSIIKAKAFENGEAPSSGFETIGREIAERCKGLPLAANVVGGLLHGYKSLKEWRFVNGNRLLDVEGGENILKILKLSYDHLASPSLKKCFAYCSIFPKGQHMKNQELIEMWMAEGFIHAAGGRNEEFIGNNFLKVLLHNALLLVSERDKCGDIMSCVMHDLVHDLASSVLGSSDTADGISTPLRYMINGSTDYKPNPISKEVAQHLRTLVLEGDISDTVFTDFESLRVLILDSYLAQKLPNSIRNLIHLRLLDISETSIGELPEWIGELHHLQTLRGQKLKTVQTSTLEYLINLSHLYVSLDTNKLPAGFGRLTGLQMLKEFSLYNENGHQIAELVSLNNLKGKLKICDLKMLLGREEAEEANMFGKPNLVDLTFEWGYGYGRGGERNDESVLEGLQPHPNLKKLEIHTFKGKRFPAWTMKMAVRDGPQGSWTPLENLVELRLWWCKECEEIPMLGHLPNLKSLVLGGLKKVKFINSSPFCKLRKLRITSLEELECLPDWLFHNNPNLSKLNISSCPKLRKLPDGLHTLHSLKKLIIDGCPNLNSISTFRTGQPQPGMMLRELWIKDCRELKELPRQMMESWAPSMEILELDGLSNLENPAEVIECLAKSATCLKVLSIGSGNKEWSRERSNGIIEKLDGLLQTCCNSLTKLKLRGMDDWECLPHSILNLTALSELDLENLGVKELPQEDLPSLRNLALCSCSKLRRLSASPYSQLQYLFVISCPELKAGSEWLHSPNLRIEGWLPF